ncbi:GAF and ANTAR domain-containing protein [Candidatus Mycobacterium wuenschmannii]|uniref:GAF and ANTAR domain-containing protein n=1 Tax=Candidatus Mycobacterium wuenschmannii TaxID=3027808 RepID=A0ABY8VWM9_9MYCO|nr:GAF and ANTAR domain-containing protein [Candidatus Mycobacterium wuenschmannii]WIM87902.1 GAF and ANTAR domain-containing protein [Candidatus Mycobacterium wuenschmannii]
MTSLPSDHEGPLASPQDATGLAVALGNLAVQMQAQTDSTDLLTTIVDAGVKLLPGISWAGVAHVRGKNVLAQVPSDDVAQKLNELQDELGEGPALSALADRENLVIADLSAEERWPRFVKAATDLGVQCLMVFRLFVEREVLGVLTIYGPAPNMFSDESVVVGEIFAQHAAVALAGAAAQDQMQAAIASRDVIGQAKGILMARDKITGLQAFATMVKASQEVNLKVSAVAQFVVEQFEKQLAGTPDR